MNLKNRVWRVSCAGALAFLALTRVDLSHSQAAGESEPRVVYPKKAKLDFEGSDIEGELKNPAEFYFQYRPQEKFDSLVKRRPHFHREMLRDAVRSNR